jgi:integrase
MPPLCGARWRSPVYASAKRRSGLAVHDADLDTGLVHVRRTLLLSSGVPIFLVSRYAGHATIQTTADQYGHLVPGDEQAADLIRTTLDRAFRAGA